MNNNICIRIWLNFLAEQEQEQEQEQTFICRTPFLYKYFCKLGPGRQKQNRANWDSPVQINS